MKLSKDIKSLFGNKQSVTFGEFVTKISHKSFGVMLVILSLPSALPVPAPGYSVPFGIVLALLGFQILSNRQHVWFPKWVTSKQLPTSGDSKLLNSMVRFLEFFEKLLKPRLKPVTKGVFYRILGLLVLLCGLSMMIPIPLTNTIPAFGIFLIGLGLLEEDGLVTLAGSLVCLIGISLTSTILYFFAVLGREGINLVQENYDQFKDSIKNLI